MASYVRLTVLALALAACGAKQPRAGDTSDAGDSPADAPEAAPDATVSRCGDGVIDMASGETCEPPGTSRCDPACHLVVCGDGVRAGAEQCDDGNTTNLDGCSASCRFEQAQRVNALALAFTADAFCAKNALGGAFGPAAQTTFANAFTPAIKDGTTSIILIALGLDDLTGASGTVNLGLVSGTPATGTTTYNGTSDLDWWYATTAAALDATRTPKTVFPGTIAGNMLSAGPAEVSLAVKFSGASATFDILAARLHAMTGATSPPLASTSVTPGHLPTEHLDPALVSFATMTAGELCGDVSAQSLAAVSAPAMLVGCGIANCAECYTSTNSLLDVIVGGCTIVNNHVIVPTQPDAARTQDSYLFTENAAHVVTGCKKNAADGVLADCLAGAAYSSLFKFTTDRVIAK